MPKNKESGFKYIKPKPINKILLLLRDEILELLTYKNDRGHWYDIQKDWERTKTDLVSRSTDKLDKDNILKDDLYKVATELLQIATFGRILQTDDEDKIKNLPRLHLPYFMKQSLGASFKDLYDINTQKAYLKIDEKNEKFVSHTDHKVKSS
jgi:hypothetical protein